MQVPALQTSIYELCLSVYPNRDLVTPVGLLPSSTDLAPCVYRTTVACILDNGGAAHCLQGHSLRRPSLLQNESQAGLDETKLSCILAACGRNTILHSIEVVFTVRP